MSVEVLDREDILALHADSLENYGGSTGLRDEAALLSAIAQPFAGFGDVDLHPTPVEKAGAYLFHLVANHPFIDGNKRVGAAACVVFLRLNGVVLDAPDDDFEGLVLSVAAGQTDNASVIEFLARHVQPI